MNELISVIMSVFNENSNELIKAIESILNQTYRNIEFIIILDNPENNVAKKLLNEYSLKDKRIKIIINSTNLGLAKSLNKGIQVANGKFIARMDADDISLNNRLELQLRYLKKNDLDLVSGNCYYIDEADNIIGKKSDIPTDFNIIAKLLPYGSSIIHPSVIIKTSVINELKGYREFEVAQDYDMWLRMISAGYKIGSINEYIIYYRLRKKSLSYKNKYKQFLITKYQLYLFKQRKRNQVDEFSISNLTQFLKDKNYFNKQSNERFLKAYEKFDLSFNKINSKQYIKAIRYILEAYIGHKGMRQIINRSIRYSILKKYYIIIT